MSEESKKQTAALTVIGLSLVTIGVSTRGSLEDKTVFGVSGDFVSGLLMGVAIGLLLLAVVKVSKSR
jgi:hypothetical protein